MRRIKFIFMMESNIPFNMDPEEEIKDETNTLRYQLQTYTKDRRVPTYLSNPNYYFTFQSYMKSVDRELLENISDSE